MSEQSETFDQLMALKGVTETTGTVSEAQVEQLRRWAIGMFQNGRRTEVELTLPHLVGDTPVDSRVVEFRVIGVNKKIPVPYLPKRCRTLDSWVKKLLGDRFVTRIRFDGTLIFERKGNSKSQWATKAQPTEKPASRPRSRRSRRRK